MAFFIIALIGAGLVVAIKILQDRRLVALLLELKKFEPDFKLALSEFQTIVGQQKYVSDKQFRDWKEKYKYLSDLLFPQLESVATTDPFKQLVVDFASAYVRGRTIIDQVNNNFVQQESPVIENLLTNKQIPFNSDQVNAIASDEDNTLLVAGAGTGKTTTILGKVAYLIERMSVLPDKILLLSFTGRAVDELNQRLLAKFGPGCVKALTFHSFGFSIIGKVLGKKPELAFADSGKKEFINQGFDSLLEDPAYLQTAVEYFAYYLKPVLLKPGFKNLDDYYKYVKTQQNLTLKKELVKSQQEVMIANFLYINGINYKYEEPYKYPTSKEDYKQYRPDFYLPDYDVYIEHFGIDRNGKTHYSSDELQNSIQSVKYQNEIAWKRKLHQLHQTQLIETYSFEFTERNWKENFVNKLSKYNVRFNSRNLREILIDLRKNKTVAEITELFLTFLDLAKSNGYSLGKIEEIIKSRNNPREEAFFDVFAPIYKAYEEHLNTTGSIDFHDMLLKAAEFIKKDKFSCDYQYVIIDEFQDFSVSKSMLIQAMCKQNSETKLFCVGDDWQSIFRFAGSDISLMTNFKQAYGFTRENKLVVTNRFNDGIAIISNQFILKNPNQIQKEVRSKVGSQDNPVNIKVEKNATDANLLLQTILTELNFEAGAKKKTVFLLGRYGFNRPDNMSQIQKEFSNLSIEFLTIHASKGSEADYVIIVDVVSGKYGLPSEVSDDPILDIVLSKEDDYPHSEERRLMYVAMTRARNKVFIISEIGRQSVFVLELLGASKSKAGVIKRCKECGGEMIEKSGKFGPFLSCENYPECSYSENLETNRRSMKYRIGKKH